MNNIINNEKYSKYIAKTSDSIIVFSEKRSKYTLRNTEKRTVYKLSIDNGIIKAGNRCDKGIYYELKTDTTNERSLYLIELKGTDVEYALKQLFETYKWFKKIIKEVSLKYRIRIRVVCAKVYKGIEIEQWKKKFIKDNINDIIVKESIVETIE